MDSNYGLFAAKGVDWDALRRQYEPRAEAAGSDAELFEVLSETLSHLQDKHVWLVGDDLLWNCRLKKPCPPEEADKVLQALKAPLSEQLISMTSMSAKG